MEDFKTDRERKIEMDKKKDARQKVQKDKLKNLWVKISEDLKKLEIRCPFCSSTMKVTAIRHAHVLQANYLSPKNATRTNRVHLIFNCYSCGYVAEFDKDFFEKNSLESLDSEKKNKHF